MIPVNEPLLNGSEKKYLEECIDSGWVGSDGPFVKQFEAKFAALHHREFGISVCNGSAALEAAVLALGIGKGDEVIMPAFTIISCAAAVVKAGAVPVLVDAEEDTWNMDVSKIESKITPNTKAIMAVHTYGLPVNMTRVMEIAHKHNLKVIEDAAEAHGLTCEGKLCGSYGDLSVFSFYPNKLITTGEGGIILTNDEQLAERCRSLRNLCFLPHKRFVHEELGSNFRMTSLQAAIGLAQMERWEEFVSKKKWMGRRYTELLKVLENVILPTPETDYAENIYWVYGVVLKRESANGKGKNAEQVMKELAARGIGSRPFFYPMHLQPVFKKMNLFKGESYPVAEFLSEYGFYLPSGMAITEDQIMEVSRCLKEMLG